MYIYIYVYVYIYIFWNPQTGSRPQSLISKCVPDTPQPHGSWMFLQDHTESNSVRSPRPKGLASTEARLLWLKLTTPSSKGSLSRPSFREHAVCRWPKLKVVVQGHCESAEILHSLYNKRFTMFRKIDGTSHISQNGWQEDGLAFPISSLPICVGALPQPLQSASRVWPGFEDFAFIM